MIPVLLEMKNFLSYEDEKFDFTKITNATVVGANGAGKSSFCTDAITWALYGKGSRGDANSSENYVTTGAESCYIEFTFESNDSLYKVIRSYNARKAKTAVNLFAINKDGDEIPISIGKTRETQRFIEKDILHMTYETFVASSMVFQNKSDEFTNGMSDMERKEALISILDVDGWQKIQKKASEDIARIKGEIAIEENNIAHYEQIISQKDTQTKAKADYEQALQELLKEKADVEAIVKANQEQVYKLQEMDKQLTALQGQYNNLTNSIASNQNNLHFHQQSITTNNAQIETYRAKMNKEQKILDHKGEIEKAVKEEADINAKLVEINQSRLAIMQKQNELAQIQQNGIAWDNNLKNQLSNIEVHIANAEKQANALSGVPCASNPQLVSSCPFLSMANQAKQELQGLYGQKQQLIQQQGQNPYLAQFQQLQAELNNMAMGGNEQQQALEQQLNSRLNEVRRYSSLKARLDVATETINGFMDIITTAENNIQNAKSQILMLQEQINNQSAEQKNVKEQGDNLLNSRNNLEKTLQQYYEAQNKLNDITAKEKEINNNIVTANTILLQVKEAEDKVKDTGAVIKTKRDELQTCQIMQDACSKKAGVPALIVENAVPELESIANKVLENMMDGRLQIRLDTQVETKVNTVKEVLRITVLDDGYERKYETYSGAEKFVVDLALRIAMSKFLSRRAGASVQLFVLDEGVSCADEDNRSEILEAIRSISHEFAKVLFVTHLEEMKDCLDGKISVTKNSSGSHIKIIA